MRRWASWVLSRRSKWSAPRSRLVEIVLEHVIGRGEHRRGNGEDGFLGAATALEAEELRSEVRILGAGGGPGGLHEGGLQPGIAGTGAGGEALAGTLVEAGAEAGPTRRGGRRWGSG